MKENFLKKIIATLAKHRNHWTDKRVTQASAVGVAYFLVSLVINYFATTYATEKAGSSVPDIFLSNLPVVNVDFIVNDMAIMFFIFVLILLILEPKRIPFAFKGVALFVTIRSAFVILTHLGTYPVHTIIHKHDLLRAFNIGGDLFFSGHTGLPFLIALIFWDEKIIRYISLAASLVFGVAVILGHLHYSIDVFAAFFITYSIFHIAQKIFAKDWKLFGSEV